MDSIELVGAVSITGVAQAGLLKFLSRIQVS